MKRFLLILPLVILIPGLSYGQNEYPFTEGTIEFKNGKTLECQIQLAIGYDSLVVYKVKNHTTQYTAPVTIVKSIQTSYNTFENVRIGDFEFLMRVAVRGKVILYAHSFTGPTQHYAIEILGTGIVTDNKNSYTAVHVIYIIRRKNHDTLITEENFDDVINLLGDCKPLKAKLLNGVFKFKELPQIIEAYNKC